MQLLKMAAVLVAAIMIGNWFMAEQRKNKARRLPWYRVYLTPPGLIILGATLILPLVILCLRLQP